MQHSKNWISLLMPPPNITGDLHLGHALNNFLQDAIVRYFRLKGHPTLWIPGFDHAGIATEIMVNKWLKQQKITITNPADYQRRCLEWTHIHQTKIRKQWQQLNLLINPEYETFTLSPQFRSLVQTAFIKLYQKQLIYQAKQLVNWDPHLQTAIADIEVEHRSVAGKLYYIRYYLVNPHKHQPAYLVVATTRPETIFADQALLVHPQDRRYSKLQETRVLNPLTNQTIPILTDSSVDPQFGTGVLKCTPGHDFADWKLGKIHNLKAVSCLDATGKLNQLGLEFQHLDRLVARNQIVSKLTKQDRLVKIVNHHHNVPYSSRSGVVIEPFVSTQWFLKTAQWTQQIWNKRKQLNFVPVKYHQNLLNWVQKTHDWCISRQLSWGHRLPVYFHNQTGVIKVTTEQLNPQVWTASNDVLDTWFSSALWAIANFGWEYPDRQALTPFLPITYLVTSYDIIFFWVVKMLFFSLEFKQQIPFQKILIHGLVRTKNHQKMSKSKGNVLNPLDLIAKYSSDALRLYLLTNYKIGDDLTFETTKLIQAHQFVHKLNHIARFLQKLPLQTATKTTFKHPLNQWLAAKFNTQTATFHTLFHKHLFSVVGQTTIEFIWKDFSNFYLPWVNCLIANGFGQETYYLLSQIWPALLQLMHPFMPTTSETLFHSLTSTDLIKTPFSNYQLAIQPTDITLLANQFVTNLKQVLTLIKPTAVNLANQSVRLIEWTSPDTQTAQTYQTCFNQLLKVKRAEIKTIKPGSITTFKLINAKLTIEEERQIVIQKVAYFTAEVQRSQTLMQNQQFLAKAKTELVQKEKLKSQQNQQKLSFWQQKLKSLK